MSSNGSSQVPPGKRLKRRASSTPRRSPTPDNLHGSPFSSSASPSIARHKRQKRQGPSTSTTPSRSSPPATPPTHNSTTSGSRPTSPHSLLPSPLPSGIWESVKEFFRDRPPKHDKREVPQWSGEGDMDGTEENEVETQLGIYSKSEVKAEPDVEAKLPIPEDDDTAGSESSSIAKFMSPDGIHKIKGEEVFYLTIDRLQELQEYFENAIREINEAQALVRNIMNDPRYAKPVVKNKHKRALYESDVDD